MSAKLLIAEDDVLIRGMIAEFLRDVGYDVVEAGNADEAVAVLESGQCVDLLFTDVRMPGSMDGCDLARRVQNDWPATRVILTSGYSNSLADARAAHDMVVSKPYRPLSVLATILSVVEP